MINKACGNAVFYKTDFHKSLRKGLEKKSTTNLSTCKKSTRKKSTKNFSTVEIVYKKLKNKRQWKKSTMEIVYSGKNLQWKLSTVEKLNLFILISVAI